MQLDFKLSRRSRLNEQGERSADLREFSPFCHHKGNSSTQSNPTTSTNITDQRVAGSEGSVVAGSGASIAIQSTDASVVKETGDAIASIAAKAIDAGESMTQTAVGGNVAVAQGAFNLSGKALDTNRAVTSDALDFGDSVAQAALVAAQKSQESANDLVRATNQEFVGALASNAGPAPTAVAGDTLKYVVIGAVVIAAAIILRPSNSK